MYHNFTYLCAFSGIGIISTNRTLVPCNYACAQLKNLLHNQEACNCSLTLTYVVYTTKLLFQILIFHVNLFNLKSSRIETEINTQDVTIMLIVTQFNPQNKVITCSSTASELGCDTQNPGAYLIVMSVMWLVDVQYNTPASHENTSPPFL